MFTRTKISDFFPTGKSTMTTNNPKNILLESIIAPASNNPNTNTLSNWDSNGNDAKLFIFTDGSQIRKKHSHESLAVAWAYVFKLRDGTTLHSRAELLRSNDTNQRAELMAIHEALSFVLQDEHMIKTFREVNLYTDSEYSMKSLSVWWLLWAKNQWKNSRNEPVKNTDIIKPTLDLCTKLHERGVRLNIRHIQAHTDRTDFFTVGNRQADSMAHALAKKRSLEKK